MQIYSRNLKNRQLGNTKFLHLFTSPRKMHFITSCIINVRTNAENEDLIGGHIADIDELMGNICRTDERCRSLTGHFLIADNGQDFPFENDENLFSFMDMLWGSSPHCNARSPHF